jgi:hypothetical protein
LVPRPVYVQAAHNQQHHSHTDLQATTASLARPARAPPGQGPLRLSRKREQISVGMNEAWRYADYPPFCYLWRYVENWVAAAVLTRAVWRILCSHTALR